VDNGKPESGVSPPVAPSPPTPAPAADAAERYLDLMALALTCYLWGEGMQPVQPGELRSARARAGARLLGRVLGRRGIFLARAAPYDPRARAEGLDHPLQADTMIGLARLANLRACVVDVLRRNVPGDLIETGVWRGGATIYMRAILAAYGVTDRTVWVADSFRGLPPPDPGRYPADAGDLHHQASHLAVGLEQVRANFAKYGLLDERVRFLEGWFKDTLPRAPIERLAVLRLDGDLYESTMDALVHLYPKLSPGGYVIVDDYGYAEACRRAVADYRERHGIGDEILPVDWSGVYWRRGS
jgi:hypothetical protein